MNEQLFRAAMEAYDKEPTHSGGIWAVIDLAQQETRREIRQLRHDQAPVGKQWPEGHVK